MPIIDLVLKCCPQEKLRVSVRITRRHLKALSSTGFKIHNKCNVLISVGSYQDKCELFNYIKLLGDIGFTLWEQTELQLLYRVKVTGNRIEQ